ncbi:MAG: nucleotidyltransferase domain-containing protein [Desulfohalobiaceae bacterium]|nr:nucleotidyltransferase domain-containing protein [Desulfohalobiaceae bacterium]
MNTLTLDIEQVRDTVQAIPEIAAAYLFGSAADESQVVNDLDLLVLTYPGINQDQAYFDILYRLTQELSLPEEQIDLVFFELDVVDPRVLHSAVNNGIIIKNLNPELLSERIDQLSLYFLINESYIKRAKALVDEQLEEFCANRQRTSETLSRSNQG